MTQLHRRATALAASGAAASLLLAACSSSSPTQAKTEAAVAARNTGSSPVADPTSASGTPLGATSPAAPTGGVDVCALVTEQEAGTALGTDPGPGEVVAGARGASSCLYGQLPAMVTVNLVPSRGQADYDHLRAQAKPGQLFDVSGVGDAAFRVSSGRAASVDFYKGDTFVAVGVITGQAGAPPGAQALALAKAAAGRI
jgi:hypothetical protein